MVQKKAKGGGGEVGQRAEGGEKKVFKRVFKRVCFQARTRREIHVDHVF